MLCLFNFLLLVKHNLLEHLKINDPKYMDLDAACFMMLTKDLLALFGVMVCSANQKVPMKDF